MSWTLTPTLYIIAVIDTHSYITDTTYVIDTHSNITDTNTHGHPPLHQRQ